MNSEKKILSEQPELMRQLRHILRELRKTKSLTQTEVGEILNKDQVFVSNCESGRRKIDPIEFLAFCSVYETSPLAIINKVKNSALQKSKSNGSIISKNESLENTDTKKSQGDNKELKDLEFEEILDKLND